MRFFNLPLTRCELRVSSCNFKKIKLQIASSFLRVANLFCGFEIKLRVPSYFLRVASSFLRVENLRKKFLRVSSCVLWVENFKKIFCDLPVTKYNHMDESNLNICKLCGKAILIKCILTIDTSNTPLAERYCNRYKDIWSAELFQSKTLQLFLRK